ncbi:hypothetical protein ACT3CD_03130 [Geofilum sp. OHC36d9]|uniref:hypothetical protein n=1 Tax=Geofilum sp. OHC36d9 TaxID=3458413 RepID=UPI0040348220
MIYTFINRPKNVSTDLIFGIIEIYFRGKYKAVSLSEKELVIRKTYKYKYNGWDPFLKQLNSTDLVCFKVLNNSIRFEVIVWKQILVLFAFLILGFAISWIIWKQTFGVSLLVPSIPVFITIAIKYYEVKKFINREKTEISERIST